jgi:hypothetical protein
MKREGFFDQIYKFPNSDLDTGKQIVKAPKPASGVVKRAMMERTVTRIINAEIVKITPGPVS